MAERVLIIGGGGREHALVRKLSTSVLVENLFVAPGNAGTAEIEKTSNVELNIKDVSRVVSWCLEKKITFVVVGPEDPLAAGIVDSLKEKSIPCFGPTAAAAEIEASKDFAKQFMTRHSIPTARFQSFVDAEAACRYIESANFDALVVKASGLAAGKGVVVASSKKEACEAVGEIMNDKLYGKAGDVVIVEELLKGPEVSVLAFCDGTNIHLMPPAQDHKRLKDNDQGPNTGGMGAVCPFPGLSDEDLDFIKNKIIQKTVTCMAAENRKYVGVLYAGLMLTEDGPKVLEYNCRFGDPETQSILALLESDLLPTLKACVGGCLPNAPPSFNSSLTAVGVVVVSGGYPGSYKKGFQISGIAEVQSSGISVIHAGTSKNYSDQVITSGGRVLAVVATDPSLTRAMELATQAAAKVKFEGAFHRKDIGAKILKRTSILPQRQSSNNKGMQYKDAGVDISAGDQLVQAIKPLAKMTSRAGCDAELGGFGGAFDLISSGFSEGVLSCCTGGVGPKIKHALTYGYHFNIGYDLVTNCANRLLSQGSQPLFFLDYFATGQLKIKVALEVVRGIAEACVGCNCALIGGETAEMPGMYRNSDYDVAGMMIGANYAEAKLLPQLEDIVAGDNIIILTSQDRGLNHASFKLLDSVMEEYDITLDDLSSFRGLPTLADEVLTTTESLVASCLPLIQDGLIKSFASVDQSLHEATDNLLPKDLGFDLDTTKWVVSPVHGWLWHMAKMSSLEFLHHSGLDMAAIAVVGNDQLDKVLTYLNDKWTGDAFVAGQVMKSTERVFTGIEHALTASKNIAFKSAHTNFEFAKKSSSAIQSYIGETSSKIAAILESTCKAGVVMAKGALPATVNLKKLNCHKPILVSGTDGVGTKLKIAQIVGLHSTIGIDLVAMCVNDVLACGAEPLFFTSYLATGLHQPEWQVEVASGIADGCQLAGCSFIDHQLSMMPSIYSRDVYDLAGFSVAAVDHSQVLPRFADIAVGDVLIGLPSSGIHSNGFSLVRHIIEQNDLRLDMPCPFSSGGTLGEILLTPTRIYVKPVLSAIHSGKIKSFAHITGGGLLENIPRALPSSVGVDLDASQWDIPAVFGWLQHLGNVSDYEMSRTFNCGLGGILVVGSSDVHMVMSSLSESGEQPRIVGKVASLRESDETVRISNLGVALESSWARPKKNVEKKNVAVLISGSGTNLQALIDHTQEKGKQSCAQITLVISNKAGVYGLTRAKHAGIPTLVINHKDFKSRSAFDMKVHEVLVQHEIDLVCLAGFMRILTGDFVNKWTGRMLNIHPSLLPAFKGAHAHRMVLEAKVRISGCSVHFVAEEVDAGAILVQESIPVFHGDTEDTLSSRVKVVEHKAYPKALEIVASGQVSLGDNNSLVWHW